MKERCPFCKNEVNYPLIPASAHPESDACCYECLPEDTKEAYDEFFGRSDVPPFKVLPVMAERAERIVRSRMTRQHIAFNPPAMCDPSMTEQADV
jgi:hypothetical protein